MLKALKDDMKNADLAESAQLTQRDWAEPWIYETHQPLTPRRGIGDFMNLPWQSETEFQACFMCFVYLVFSNSSQSNISRFFLESVFWVDFERTP